MVVKTNQFNVNLHEAIAVGDVMSCEKLIKLPGVDINGKFGREQYTPLHRACHHGQVEAVHWLLWHAADKDLSTQHGWTPAHIAALRGHDQCMQALITHGAQLNNRDQSGQCAVHIAAAHGNTFTLQTMCRKGVDVACRDLNGWLPIHHAAYHGRLGCVQTLLKWDAGCEVVTVSSGDTPLHLAAAEGHLNVLKHLLSSVVDAVSALSAVNNDGMTPLELAKQYQKLETIDYLSNIQLGDTDDTDEGYPAHYAAATGDVAALKQLIGTKLYSVDCRDEFGSTPAHKAAGHGHIHCLQWLIDQGAEAALLNSAGETVRDVAKRFAKMGCVALLGEEEGLEGEDAAQHSPAGAIERGLRKLAELEHGLELARANVVQLGGTIPLPVNNTPNPLAKEAQELREQLEYERLRREKMEITMDELRKQLEQFTSKAAREEKAPSPASTVPSTPTKPPKPSKGRTRDTAITRGVFVKRDNSAKREGK